MSKAQAERLEEATAEAIKARAEAEAEKEKAIRTLVRVRIYRTDNTIDESVQTFPRMKKGETVTFSITPDNV